MGEKSSRKKKKQYSEQDSLSSSESSSDSSSSSSSDEDESRRSKKHRRKRKTSSSRREKERRSKKRKRSTSSKKDKDGKSSTRRRSRRKYSDDSDSDSEFGGGNGIRDDPVDVVKFILTEFPAVANDLEQLLRMIDAGQAVDISGLSEKSLVEYLRKLFLSLNLNDNGRLVFLLPSGVRPTLEVVGAVIRSPLESKGPVIDTHQSHNDIQAEQPIEEHKPDDGGPNLPSAQEDVAPAKKRVIGPAMPSAELLAAAAKLTEAEAELREAEVGDDDALFIGPPPPAVVNEAASANDAERFEEVTRIMGADVDNPYDVVGVNRNMVADNLKKRYWKLSLMVHPDKCTHPEAHQAFIKLNKAFKDLQDPVKKKAMDDKIDEKEEKERFKLELKAMREAAQWRRLQGIAMEGDDELLAEMDVKEEKKKGRDEWMTVVPPERKAGVATQQSTKAFSRTSREGRGDTSVWTDTPSDRAQKAKMNYLEAYNEAAALAAAGEQEKKTNNADAELVDKYNKAKRSKSLVEKHQEATRVRSKKKSKQDQDKQKQEWAGQHPWKPWDRDKDLTAGRQNVKLDAENMTQGLTSRFSSGSFQRNFL